MSAGNLTDGLPLWNMGGPVPALQLRWDAASASAGVRIRVRLARTWTVWPCLVLDVEPTSLAPITTLLTAATGVC